MRVGVLSAADGAPWEERWVVALDTAQHGISIVRRCVDVIDLVAAAASGQGGVALLSASLRRLDAEVIDRLMSAGVVPVAVVARGDVDAENRIRALGVGFVVPDDTEPSVLGSVIAEAVRDAALPPGARRTFADTGSVRVRPDVPALPESGESAPTARHGRVVAVWGPTGAPGRTTIATALADEFAALGSDAMLVDADVYGGAIATVVGLLDESPGLAAACRQASSAGFDADALAALCWQITSRMRVLTGIPLASRWTELRPTAVAAVLATARRLVDVIVVDCGFCLETDEELSFDTAAPRRNGATLAVLDDADLIIAVGAADPIGIQRLVRGLRELRDAEIDAPVRVVLNRVRREVVPGRIEAELTDAMQRFAGTTPAALLPLDGAVDTALAAGRLLREVAPNSALRVAVAGLAASAFVRSDAAEARARHARR